MSEHQEMEPTPPAVVEYLRECERIEYGYCDWKKEGGWDVGLGHWDRPIGEGITLLNRIQKKSDLAIFASPLQDADLRKLTETERLRYLELQECPLSGTGLDLMPVCDKLDTLILSQCPIDGKCLIGLRRFPNLKSLTLVDVVRNADDALKHASALTHLDSIHLQTDDSTYTGDGLVGLSKMKSLRAMTLHKSTIQRGFGHLVGCTSLRQLEVSDTLVTDDALKEISTISSLDNLYISSPSVTNEGVAHLSSLKNIEWLGVLGPMLSPRCVDGVSRMKCVRYLALGCPIDEKAAESLSTSQHLLQLSIYGKGNISKVHFDMIKQALPNCRVNASDGPPNYGLTVREGGSGGTPVNARCENSAHDP